MSSQQVERLVFAHARAASSACRPPCRSRGCSAVPRRRLAASSPLATALMATLAKAASTAARPGGLGVELIGGVAEQVERGAFAFVDQQPKSHRPAHRRLRDQDARRAWATGTAWSGPVSICGVSSSIASMHGPSPARRSSSSTCCASWSLAPTVTYRSLSRTNRLAWSQPRIDQGRGDADGGVHLGRVRALVDDLGEGREHGRRVGCLTARRRTVDGVRFVCHVVPHSRGAGVRPACDRRKLSVANTCRTRRMSKSRPIPWRRPLTILSREYRHSWPLIAWSTQVVAAAATRDFSIVVRQRRGREGRLEWD